MKKAKPVNIAAQEVEFITTPVSSGNEVFTPHSEYTQSPLRKKVGLIKEDYQVILNQIGFIIGDSDSRVRNTGFSLDEIKISLGFNAKGKLAFIAEAGVEASVEVTFKRKKSS